MDRYTVSTVSNSCHVKCTATRPDNIAIEITGKGGYTGFVAGTGSMIRVLSRYISSDVAIALATKLQSQCENRISTD